MARAVFETTKKYSIGAQMAAFNILNPEGNYGYSDKFVSLVPYSFVFYIEEQKIRSYLGPGGEGFRERYSVPQQAQKSQKHVLVCF